MNERDELLKELAAAQIKVDKLDRALAREITSAYNNARRELMADLVDAFAQLGDDPTPEQIRTLLSQTGLINGLQTRIDELGREFSLALQSALTETTQISYISVSNEIRLLALGLGIADFIPLTIDPLLELTVGPALDQVPALAGQLKNGLRATLRSGLGQGERMEELTRQLYGRGKDTGIFQRGLTSALLMTHRAVSEAENTARAVFLASAAKQIPGLKKQAISRLDAKTSITCLRVHGQIQPVDEPFELTGPMAFSRRQQTPPFHWGPCRTSVTGYHERYEVNSSLKTADMVAQAEKIIAAAER